MNPKTAMAIGKSKEFGYIAAILDQVSEWALQLKT